MQPCGKSRCLLPGCEGDICFAQYGKQYVPVSPEDEVYLAYRPDRGIHLMGFCDDDKISQHQHIKVSLSGSEHTARSSVLRTSIPYLMVDSVLFIQGPMGDGSGERE
jgi:hypothetical protein